METNQKIACWSIAIFVAFILLGITQCFFPTMHACWRINGACPGVWVPFVYIWLPYLLIKGREKNQLLKYGMVMSSFSFLNFIIHS